jgi:Mg-chelatase subunit ChlD
MRKEILTLILFLQIFCLILNQSSISLEIQRSRSHFDQTGKLTPLVVSLSSEDKIEKIKGVDLICIVDVSGSMSSPRNKIELVKESLKYLVNLMNEEDNLALVTFDTSSKIVKELTKMTSENKTILLKDIDNLYASGGTNIYQGLDKALSLITTDYSNGERIASMILLSDGIDNYSGADTKFIKLLSDTGKNNYTFTLHTFGYGNDHDPLLLTKIARIRDSGFFPISQLIDIQEAYLKIYGSLSTICYINTQLIIESNFKIEKIYGMDEMYNTTFNNKTAPYTFSILKLDSIIN